jgi:DNA (cytosine-5)-methyltransferase 1
MIVASKTKKFKFIDLFAGVGGIRMAFEKAGCQCVFTSEWDAHSQKTYAANFGDLPRGDITKIDAQDIPEFDILTAGFPCQPFSSMGLREGFRHKTQGTLFYDVTRILEHHRPKAFLLENVAGLVTHDQGKTLKTIFEVLKELRYDVWFKILDSADFNVPQHRDRIYIVGMRIDSERPSVTPLEPELPLFNQNNKSNQRFVFPTGSPKKIGVGKFIKLDVDGYEISKRLQKSYIYKHDDGRPQIVDPKSNFPVKTFVASYHKIQRLTGTFVRDGKTGLRLLSESECKSLMGFPKKFTFPVSRTQMYRQIGNSVAVPVVAAIAKQLTTAMQCDKAPEPRKSSSRKKASK